MTGTDGGIIDNGAIVIEGDRITAVGPLASISVAATSDRLSAHRRAMIVEEIRREARRIENSLGNGAAMPVA